MKTQSCLLSLVLALSGGFTAAVHAQSNAPAIRFVIAVHSEEPGGTPNTPDFRTTTPAIYDSWRRAILWFARECAARGLPWDWESEWNFLEGVKRFETAAGANYAPAFFTNTAGKNVEKYLQDDLRVELDPHSHENSGYNYADVASISWTSRSTPRRRASWAGTSTPTRATRTGRSSRRAPGAVTRLSARLTS